MFSQSVKTDGPILGGGGSPENGGLVKFAVMIRTNERVVEPLSGAVVRKIPERKECFLKGINDRLVFEPVMRVPSVRLINFRW